MFRLPCIGVCEAEECQALCLSDVFGDSNEEARSTCDGYAAIISGPCGDECPDDSEDGLQQARFEIITFRYGYGTVRYDSCVSIRYCTVRTIRYGTIRYDQPLLCDMI